MQADGDDRRGWRNEPADGVHRGAKRARLDMVIRNLGGLSRRGAGGRDAEILADIETGDLLAGNPAFGGQRHSGRVVKDR